MTDETKIGLLVRRSKAMLLDLDRRAKEFAEKKAKGEHTYGGPTLGDYHHHFKAIKDAIDQYEETTGEVHIPFKTEITEAGSVHERTVETHESFGLVSLSRRTGGHGATHLFGSRVEYHPVTIALTIRRAERLFSNDLSYDTYHHMSRVPPVVEIEMSSAQFTDALTMMNMGEGIPCTIKDVNGVRMEPVPSEHRSEQHMIRKNFRSKMAAVREEINPHRTELDEILAKKAVGKKDKERIAWLFEKLTRISSDSAAFTLDQFSEATQKLETEAKKEVEAYANSILVAAGIEHLKSQAPGAASLIEGEPTRKLTEGSE